MNNTYTRKFIFYLFDYHLYDKVTEHLPIETICQLTSFMLIQ